MTVTALPPRPLVSLDMRTIPSPIEAGRSLPQTHSVVVRKHCGQSLPLSVLYTARESFFAFILSKYRSFMADVVYQLPSFVCALDQKKHGLGYTHERQ